MATTYNRRLTIWINGKEVENNIKAIKGEMSTLVNAQRLMTVGTKKYVAAAKEIKNLNGIIAKHNAELRAGESSWQGLSKAADKFNRYFAMFTAGAASVAGLVMGLRSAVDTFNEFEKSVANLSAITGLTGNDLKWLGDKAKELSVSTTESGVRITASATDIVEGFKLMGSARPELLANKEALAQVTEKALILAAAAGIEMAPAVDAVAASMNQFNLDASQSDRIINAIAAGSLVGSAEVGDLTESMKNVGTVANDSNMSLEQTVAALEILGEKQLKGAEAGTKLRGALLKMKDAQVGYASGSFVLKDAIVEVNNKLAAQGSELERDALKQKVFGIENITAGNILLQNIDKYDKLTAAVTGTNVAFDQAKTATNTNSAKLAQAKNAVNILAIEFGEKLAPAMTFSTNAFAYFMKAVLGAPAFFARYSTVIIALTGALLVYNAGLLKNVAVSLLNNMLLKEGIGLKIKDAVVLEALIIKEKLLTIWKAEGTVATKAATTMQWLWNAALAANPIGLVIAAITALVVAIKVYDSNNAESVRLEKEKETAVKDLATANALLQKAYDNQSKAMENINSMSLEQKKNLADLTEATLKQAEAELVLAKAKQAQIAKDNTKTTAWQGFTNAIVGYASPGAGIANNIADAALNGAEAAAAMNDGIGALEEGIKQLRSRSSSLNEILNSEQMADAIMGNKLTGSQLEEKQRYLQIALKNYAKGTDDFNRISKKLAEVDKQMGTGGGGGALGAIEQKITAYQKLTTNVAELNKQLQDMYASGIEPSAEFIANLKAQEQKVIDITNAVAVAKNGFQSYLTVNPDEPVADNTDYTVPEDQNPITGEPMEVGNKMSPEDKRAFAIAQAQTTSNALFDIVKSRQQSEYDHKLSLLEKQKAAELNNKNLTEKQKADIEEKYRIQEKKIKTDAFKKEKATAIIQAVINTALAIMNALATGGPAAIPLSIAAGITGAAQIAVIAAQETPEFSQGGYTLSSNSNQTPAGIVHANEYVIPAEGVNNPRLRPFLDTLEMARLNKSLPTLNPAVISSTSAGRFSSGGYTSTHSGNMPTSGSASGSNISILDMSTAMLRFADAVDKLQKDGVRGNWSLFDLEKIQKNKSQLESATNM